MVRLVGYLGVLLALGSTALAQGVDRSEGTIRGRIVSPDGEPVPGAVVVLEGDLGGAVTEADGTFVIEGVVAGAHVLRIEATGYTAPQRSMQVVAGATTQANVTMETLSTPGEVIVVTGTRVPEKRLDAPVTVEVVSEKDIAASAGSSYLSALSNVKGIDYADNGLSEQRISARGFTTQFNSRMVTMLDGRLAQLPGSGLPQNNMLPSAGLDVKAVEVVVGPASALYGPNAHTGVINVITKTPWDESGISAALRGGTQSLFDGTVRVAGTIADDFGWKLNAQYMNADDFAPSRAAETHNFGTSVFEGDLVGNYDLESAKADGNVYYRFGDWIAKAAYGFSQTSGFSITNAGRNHIRDWQVNYQTAQLVGPNWFAQVTRTATDAGRSYQLDRLARLVDSMGGIPSDPAELDAMRDSIAFVDNSSMVDSELQYRNQLLGVETTAGVQYRAYMPDSDGTYLADAVEDIDTSEIGGYLQLDRHLLDDRLRLAGAARVDRHSNYPTQFSPKASVQYEVVPLHNVRVGYNRAFKSPTVLENNLFINDILLGNRTGFVIRDSGGAVVAEIDPLVPEEVHSAEVGYKGVFGNLVFVDAVAYNSWYRNFISALTQVANPAAADPTFAELPDGTPVADGLPVEGTLFTYVNFGQAQVRGVDVGVTFQPIPEIGLTGGASAIELVEFTNDDMLQRDLTLNVPRYKLKGSVMVENLGIDDYFVRVAGRYHSPYAFESGYWNSDTLLGGHVPSRFVLDLSAGYRFPAQGLTLSAAVSNVLDNHTPDVLGAPTPARLAWLQLAYSFDGMRF